MLAIPDSGPRTAVAGSPPRAAAWLSVALTVGSRLANAAAQAVILVLVARLSGAAGAAALVWAMAITAPVFMFANLNLRAVIATETRSRFGFADYWRVRLVSVAAAVGAIAILTPFTTELRVWPLVALVAIGKAIEAVHDLILGSYHRRERPERAAASLIVRSAGGCAALGAVLATTGNVAAGFAAMTAVQLALLAVLDLPYLRRAEPAAPAADWSHARAIARIALPLGVVGCLTSLALNAPRYVVGDVLDDHALAGFGCCASVLQLFTLVGVATQLALSPRIAAAHASERSSLRRLLLVNVAAACGLGAIAAVLAHAYGDRALALLYGAEYAAYAPVLTWLMIGGAFAASKGFLATALTAARATVSQAAIAAVQAAASALGCVWLVPRYGVVAAAWMVAAAAALSLVLHALRIFAAPPEVRRA